ncbi:RelA/SpoT domain-containing protein [Pseudomonas sp. C2B4]|uniref:RelA/SpoT domain-containing protein n=1 Tax=Pseudomonas sp. C2B4 TaxID=2735270 RepID=UPI001586824F|nr:RelA/SpoT domain-containing protein [Pseudomonas sp. C2B4]NUU34687.1 RelA/SpoT domain-containing protein [Pseudomonas sp. C2B4]
MPFEYTREAFLEEADISQQDWEKSSLDWDQLVLIANHHDSARHALALNGGHIANRIQAFRGVHSVRWRVKDTFGLIKKIIRKNLEEHPKEKWQTINRENYRSVVSDLIGVRALHLLREECFEIDAQLRETYDVYDVTVFKREGDHPLSEIVKRGATEKPHDAGYRSIHYGFTYAAEKEHVIVEIQVRTIFQEGWSEIDHKVRYPDFSNNDLLKYFIGVFNGFAGTADDMGSFVIKLHNLINATSAAELENEVILASKNSDIEKLQQQIDQLRSDGSTSEETIRSLQSSVNNIKEKNSINPTYTTLARAMTDMHVPNLLPNNSDQLKMLSKFSMDPKMKKIIDDFVRPNAAIAELVERMNRPNPSLTAAIEEISRHNAALTTAMAKINQPNAALASALENITRQDSAIAKALENFPRTNTDDIKTDDEPEK